MYFIKMKNKISEIKNSIAGFNRTMGMARELVNEKIVQ